jgi:hypothetical protein
MCLVGEVSPWGAASAVPPAIRGHTPWVQPGTDSCKIQAAAGRTRERQFIKTKKCKSHCEELFDNLRAGFATRQSSIE